MSGFTYSAVCCECNKMEDSKTPIADGTYIPHVCTSYDHNGFAVMHECNGKFVSIMRRTEAQIMQKIREISEASSSD